MDRTLITLIAISTKSGLKFINSNMCSVVSISSAVNVSVCECNLLEAIVSRNVGVVWVKASDTRRPLIGRKRR